MRRMGQVRLASAARVASWALIACASAIFAASFGLGCRGGKRPPRGRVSNATEPQRGGVLRFSIFSDLPTALDPAVSFDTETAPLLQMIFSGLVTYDAKGNIVPDLAERWEVLDGGRTYRFHLRHGVRMHDGEELVADDVKRSAERTLAKATGCPAASFYDHVVGAAAYGKGEANDIAGIVVESSHVVTFELDAPDATFLALLVLNFMHPTCKNAGRTYDPSYEDHLCGAGPFKLGTYQQGRFLRLERWNGYFVPGLPYLDAIELRMAVPTLTQRFELERGDVDYGREFARPDLIRFQSDPAWAPFGIPSVEKSTYGESLNVEVKPFDDRRIRQAVAAAFDRPHLEKFFEGAARITGRLLPPGVPGHELPVREQVYDLERARRLMAEAGYPYDPVTGKGGYPETITYLTGESEGSMRFAQLLQYDLAQIGLRLEIRAASSSLYYVLSGRRRATSIGYTGWNADFADPSDFFEPIFTAASISEEGSQNHAFYSNPELEKLLVAARAELDTEKRLAMYQTAEQLVIDDAPWAFKYNLLRYEVLQPYVRGYTPHPLGLGYFRDTWIDAAAQHAMRSPFSPFTSEGGGSLGALLHVPRAKSPRLPIDPLETELP